MKKLSWKGSAKDVRYDQETGELNFDFTRRVSIFDIGQVPAEFPELDVLRYSIATRIFEYLREQGSVTHFMKRTGTTSICVQPFDIPEKGIEFPNSRGRLLPCEFLFRYVVSEGLCSRILAGAVDKEIIKELILRDQKLEPGAELKAAFVECSTKHQDADEYLSDQDAARLADLSLVQFYRVTHGFVSPVASLLQTFFRRAGFRLLDGKFEIGLTYVGRPVLVDSISPDELRLHDEQGMSYDKDPVRRYYKETYPEWHKQLLRSKKAYPTDKSQWPGYPAPPSGEVIQETVRRYRAVAEAIRAI